MMRKATGKQAKMWGAAIVGYGNHHYKYACGREDVDEKVLQRIISDSVKLMRKRYNVR
jgi:hypothetical protein